MTTDTVLAQGTYTVTLVQPPDWTQAETAAAIVALPARL